ncbi:hypothetical protein QM198_09840 [Serratia marcescens]|uniref:hypothetical protein n=1 Tax=Serratia marcescens TaxID=615 RepID=UPI00294A8F71|nr:hypothetical protein [Serratia marcescens]MDV5743129.1 hypothetical protein [Serratia marcescens]MDV5748042.1 hypothetical protein [Serratia marcescens]MDV5779478.1 hypothetical protein [Serratia marcescens]MDV5784419.1 hypothetical protein [Serratia marcescens]MDV5831317.1 hypothetical protein [Serratia marcescens]
MFSKEQVKEFIVKLGKKIIFPEITNVISRRVLTVGIVIILGVNPYSIFMANWLVDAINNSGVFGFSLPYINDQKADYIWGVVLIALVMLHNIFFQWFKFHLEKIEKKNGHDEKMAVAEREENRKNRDLDEIKSKNEKRMKADEMLFERFLSIFASDSPSADLLKNHDFWAPYYGKKTEQLDKFVDLGVTEETKFLDDDLEKARDALWKECYEFSYELAKYSRPAVSNGCFTVIPPEYVGVYDTPQWLDESVDRLNRKSHKCMELHQQLVRLCRQKFDR